MIRFLRKVKKVASLVSIDRSNLWGLPGPNRCVSCRLSQTLKKLKGKQEENKKREITRLLSKLDEHAGLGPPLGRLSELIMPGLPDESGNLENTDW